MTASPSPAPAAISDTERAAEIQALQQAYSRLCAAHADLSAADVPNLAAIDQVHRDMDAVQSRLRALTLQIDEAGFRERPAGI